MTTLDQIFQYDPSVRIVTVNTLGASRLHMRRRIPIKIGEEMIVIGLVNEEGLNDYRLAYNELGNIWVKGDRDYFVSPGTERK